MEFFFYDPKNEFTVNYDNASYQYTIRNTSLNKLLYMYTNADCLSNELNELTSEIDTCDAFPHLIGAMHYVYIYIYSLCNYFRIFDAWLFLATF